MSNKRAGEWSLLPTGLQDLLPPEASHEAACVARLLERFAAQGYHQVKPPLLEFEDALLSGTGVALAPRTFRLMDPVSQRMMGLRADITPQVVRLAASRLAMSERPLRLCYAGEVLQVRGSQLRPERQFTQVGVELIEAEQPAADAEVIALGADALLALGVRDLSVDLNLPPLVQSIAETLGLSPDIIQALRGALDHKDAAAVSAAAGAEAGPFLALLRAAGPAEDALERLAGLDLPPAAKQEVDRLTAVAAGVLALQPGLSMTLDPVEHRGFEYQTGISFTYFARGVRGELGRGGRYETPVAPAPDAASRPSSTGFTIFMDSVMRAVPATAPPDMVFLPSGTDPREGRRLREAGQRTVAALDDGRPADEEARRMGCSHIWQGGRIMALSDQTEPEDESDAKGAKR